MKKKVFFAFKMGVFLGLVGISYYVIAMEVGEKEEVGELIWEEDTLIGLDEQELMAKLNLTSRQLARAKKLARMAVEELTQPDEWSDYEYMDLNYKQKIINPLFTILHHGEGISEPGQLEKNGLTQKFIEWYVHTSEKIPDWMKSKKWLGKSLGWWEQYYPKAPITLKALQRAADASAEGGIGLKEKIEYSSDYIDQYKAWLDSGMKGQMPVNDPQYDLP